MAEIAKPTTTIANSASSAPTTTAHSSACQNVRICRAKCDSSHVPRASPRLTSCTITAMIDGQPNEEAPMTRAPRSRDSARAAKDALLARPGAGPPAGRTSTVPPNGRVAANAARPIAARAACLRVSEARRTIKRARRAASLRDQPRARPLRPFLPVSASICASRSRACRLPIPRSAISAASCAARGRAAPCSQL